MLSPEAARRARRGGEGLRRMHLTRALWSDSDTVGKVPLQQHLRGGEARRGSDLAHERVAEEDVLSLAERRVRLHEDEEPSEVEEGCRCAGGSELSK